MDIVQVILYVDYIVHDLQLHDTRLLERYHDFAVSRCILQLFYYFYYFFLLINSPKLHYIDHKIDNIYNSI